MLNQVDYYYLTALNIVLLCYFIFVNRDNDP